MSMRQVGLLTAGAQPWSPRMCSARGDRFAYCSTLAIYIYEWDSNLKKFNLHSVVSAQKKTITSISWNPKDPNILASASTEKEIILWDISDQRVIARLKQIKEAPNCIEWSPHEKDVVSFIYGCGPLFLWNSSLNHEVTSHKETFCFYSEITQFSWNQKRAGKLAFGHKDGSLSLLNPGKKSQKHVLRPENSDENDEEDSVQMLEWDSLSIDYLLVAYKNRTGIRLIDTDSTNVIMSFKLPSAAARISGFSWILNAPGMFVSGDTQSGVLRLWSVSRSSPVLNLKIKETGFHSICVIPRNQTSNHMLTQQSKSTVTSSTSVSLGKSSSSSQSNIYEIPPAHVVCTFLDGGIGLYDINKRRWDFLRDYGHIETIFDCKFHPDDPDLLATCSFDGTIKVWNIQTMEAVKSTARNETAIYSISWAPGDLNCLVAATSRSGCFIWDVEKERIIMRFNEHGKSSVYTASWNQRDSKYIASAGNDGNCIVRMVDGTLVKKYKHPGSVFGCDWSPNNRDLLATGCDDKIVRVFYLPSKGETAIRTFTGHTSKIFHVKWSPLREGILCSGSDDGTIRVWDYSQEGCVTVLEGHTAPVRGILWHSELSEILISGSWDYSIRIWNVKTGYCIEKNTDHAADVYGLACHRQRPFILASSSRDSTVRIWILDYFAKPLYLRLLCGHQFTDAMQAQPVPEEEQTEASPEGRLKLAGTFSSHVNSLIEHESDKYCRKVAKLYSQLFLAPFGLKNLWVLVSVLLDADQQQLPSDYSKGIMHTRHAVRYRASQAQELETVRASNYGFSIGNPKKDAKLLEAADIQLKMGQLERYCEIMLELGHWDKALAVAPGVSLEYWKLLSKRRADQLISEDNIDAVPYCVAVGQIDQLIDFFTSRCQLQDAVMIAEAACEGYFSNMTSHDENQNLKGTSIKREPVVNGVDHPDKDGPKLLQETSNKLADWYFMDAQPVLASCCHLAVGDTKNAIAKLIRSNEIELALCLCRILPDSKDLLEISTLLLVRRCEKLGHWDDALALLANLENKEKHLMKLCARFSGSHQEINDMHSKAGLPSLEDCAAKAAKLKEEHNVPAALEYMILSASPEHTLEVGLSLIKGIFAKKLWSLDEILPITDILSCIRSEKLQQGKLSKLRHELLVITAYVGALHAIRKKYYPVVLPLFQAVRNTASAPASLPSEDQKHVWNSLKEKIGTETNEYDCGEYMVAGSHFPSHSEAHLSMFTKRKIKGHVFFLEDGFSALPYNEALMWARVNSFSPLGSGLRINPF